MPILDSFSKLEARASGAGHAPPATRALPCPLCHAVPARKCEMRLPQRVFLHQGGGGVLPVVLSRVLLATCA